MATYRLVGLPAYLIRRLQSVQNEYSGATYIPAPSFRPHCRTCLQSPLVTSARKDRLHCRHACRLIGRCTLMLRCTFGTRQFTRSDDMPYRQRLRSSTTDSVSVPAIRLSTVGCRAFPVAGACIWNHLPSDITSSLSLFTFKQRQNALIPSLLPRSYLLTVPPLCCP